VVEASLAQVKSSYPESMAHPNAVVGSLIAIQERWDIQVIWCDTPELAEETVAHILSKHYTLQWLKDNRLPRHFVDGDI
jgi:ERCC4-type nuclease